MERYFDVLNTSLDKLTPEHNVPPMAFVPAIPMPLAEDEEMSVPSGMKEDNVCSNGALAMAYVRSQPMATPMYDDAEALKAGTLYPALDKPFTMGRMR